MYRHSRKSVPEEEEEEEEEEEKQEDVFVFTDTIDILGSQCPSVFPIQRHYIQGVICSSLLRNALWRALCQMGWSRRMCVVCVCVCCVSVCAHKFIYVPCQMGWSRRNPKKTTFVDSVSLSF